MCGPYGHGYLGDDPDPTGDPAGLLPKSGGHGGGASAVMDSSEDAQSKPTSKGFRSWLRKIWPKRLRMYGPGGEKPTSMSLPGGSVLYRGYPWLNSHSEVERAFRVQTNGLVPCGIELHSGELLLQGNRGHTELPLGNDAIKSIENDWKHAMSGGRLAEFLFAQAGRLGDLHEWKTMFHLMLDRGYVMSRLKGRANKERYGALEILLITERAIRGVSIPGMPINFLPHGAPDKFFLEYSLEIHRQLRCSKSIDRHLSPVLSRLWGRGNEEAAETLLKYPNDVIAAMN